MTGCFLKLPDASEERLLPEIEITRLKCTAAYHGRMMPAAADAERVSAVLALLKPRRLLLLVNSNCIPLVDDKHPAAESPVVFDVQVSEGGQVKRRRAGEGGQVKRPPTPLLPCQVDGLTGAALILAAASAKAYLHHEEDRLTPGGVRYVPGGVGRVGKEMPPSYAKVRGGGCVRTA